MTSRGRAKKARQGSSGQRHRASGSGLSPQSSRAARSSKERDPQRQQGLNKRKRVPRKTAQDHPSNSSHHRWSERVSDLATLLGYPEARRGLDITTSVKRVHIARLPMNLSNLNRGVTPQLLSSIISGLSFSVMRC